MAVALALVKAMDDQRELAKNEAGDLLSDDERHVGWSKNVGSSPRFAMVEICGSCAMATGVRVPCGGA
jgi:hypothetical protein